MTEKWERWAIPEIAILKKHYYNAPHADLLRLLPGRTWKAIMGTAERYSFHRNRSIPKSKEQKMALHAKMSTARDNRTQQPFAGKHHSAEAKLAISVSNLNTRGHSIGDIAKRNCIAEKEVKKIIEEREERSNRKK